MPNVFIDVGQLDQSRHDGCHFAVWKYGPNYEHQAVGHTWEHCQSRYHGRRYQLSNTVLASFGLGNHQLEAVSSFLIPVDDLSFRVSPVRSFLL